MKWTKVKIQENGRPLDALINFDSGLVIKPIDHNKVILENIVRPVTLSHSLDYFEFLTEEEVINYTPNNVNVDVEGPKVMTKADLEKKMGKTGPVVKDEPKTTPVKKPVVVKKEEVKEATPPKIGTTSSALDVTPEVLS
jgi:hypothetical protein